MTRLFDIHVVIFLSRLNLRYCQFLSTFRFFPLKFRFIVCSGSVESQTP